MSTATAYSAVAHYSAVALSYTASLIVLLSEKYTFTELSVFLFFLLCLVWFLGREGEKGMERGAEIEELEREMEELKKLVEDMVKEEGGEEEEEEEEEEKGVGKSKKRNTKKSRKKSKGGGGAGSGATEVVEEESSKDK